MSNLKKHAERELKLLGYNLDDKEEGMNKWMMESLLELIDVFAKQGHSGFSADYCAKTYKKLALFEPLTPLTGNDDEWNEVGSDVWQNNRCSTVFKDNDGKAYDINGKVFCEPDGCCFTNNDSKVYINFPYTPQIEYINVPFNKD
jgi:hypothetical protein